MINVFTHPKAFDMQPLKIIGHIKIELTGNLYPVYFTQEIEKK